MSAPTDQLITVTLPLSVWSVVWAHIGRGSYIEVAAMMAEMARQACPQMEAAKQALDSPATSVELPVGADLPPVLN